MSGLLKGTARILQLPPMSVVASSIDGKKFIDVPLFLVLIAMFILQLKILHKYYRNVTCQIISHRRVDYNGNEWKRKPDLLTQAFGCLYNYYRQIKLVVVIG